MKIGFFPGVWDLVHVGHVVALEEAKRNCDILIVGVKEDPSVDQPTKNKPIMSVEERTKIIKALRSVNAVWTYKTETELYIWDKEGKINQAEFNIRFMGWDHKDEKHHPIKAKVVYLKGDQRYHTSTLREKIWKTESSLREQRGL